MWSWFHLGMVKLLFLIGGIGKIGQVGSVMISGSIAGSGGIVYSFQSFVSWAQV